MSTYLAVVMRHARTVKGLTQEQTGEAIHVSPSLIGMIETARRLPHPDIARRLDGLLETGDLIQKLTAEARRDAQPRWFRPWAEIEQEATSLRCYEQGIIPGLLQTEEYARTALTSGLIAPNHVEEHVSIRLARQTILDRDDPPLTTFVIDAAALHRGSSTTMKAQLLHLVEASQRPRVFIHIVPASAGLYVGQSGPFTVAAIEGSENLAFLEDQLQGRVVNEPNQVAALERAWDAVRAVALPRDLSRDFIMRLVNEL